VSVQEHTPGVRAGQTDQDVEGRRLTRPVGPQTTNHLTLQDLQVDIIDYLPPSLRLAQLDGLEFEHTASFLDPVSGPRACSSLRIPNDGVISTAEAKLTPRGSASNAS